MNIKQMSGIAVITIMGRVIEKPKLRVVKTKKGDMEVFDLAVAVDSFVAGSAPAVTFYNMTLWPGRFDKIIPRLEPGKAVFISGEFHMAKYRTESGTSGSKLVIDINQLKYSMGDSKKLKLKYAKQEQQREKEESVDEDVVLKEIFDDAPEEIIPMKRKKSTDSELQQTQMNEK